MGYSESIELGDTGSMMMNGRITRPEPCHLHPEYTGEDPPDTDCVFCWYYWSHLRNNKK